jgi:3-hydroxyacyl-[acyl-carrier-protein] dehydratase
VRWFWIDRFVEFESGRRATAEKAVTLAEEQLDNYLPGFPVMPASLIIEGFAQTGGLLVGEVRAFRQRTVLAKVGKAKFFREARPGDVLRYEVTIEELADDGAIVRGRGTLAGQLHAEVELFFAHLDDRFAGVDLFYPADFLAILRLLGVYDVGRQPDGTPLVIPPHLLEAEQRQNQDGKWSGERYE